MKRPFQQKRLSCKRILFLVLPLFIGACGGGSGTYGPAYVPQCTCCCGGGYTPYAYKATTHSSIAGPPIATAFFHETKGPQSDVSATGQNLKHRTKGHAK
ncbi:MAG: hypothetical protein ACYDBP_07320 [Leptospirales bacterium]